MKKEAFDKILSNIKDVKIQGATNVAKAGIRAYQLAEKLALKLPEKKQKRFLRKSIKQIKKTRPTEPLMHNSLKYIMNAKNTQKAVKKYLDYIKKSKTIISKKGARLIKNKMNVFSHCHSSTVISILKQAKKSKKKFIVYTTEVEPLLQGRITAKELAKSNINVIVLPDLAAEQAIKKCDLLLFGADAYSKKTIANKIGTTTLCKLAQDYNIPRYSTGISLKYTRRIKLEQRKGKEVWDERSRKISILNPAFDLTPKSLLTGVISEFGILPYNQFIKKAKQNLKKFS